MKDLKAGDRVKCYYTDHDYCYNSLGTVVSIDDHYVNVRLIERSDNTESQFPKLFHIKQLRRLKPKVTEPKQEYPPQVKRKPGTVADYCSNCLQPNGNHLISCHKQECATEKPKKKIWAWLTYFKNIENPCYQLTFYPEGHNPWTSNTTIANIRVPALDQEVGV